MHRHRHIHIGMGHIHTHTYINARMLKHWMCSFQSSSQAYCVYSTHTSAAIYQYRGFFCTVDYSFHNVVTECQIWKQNTATTTAATSSDCCFFFLLLLVVIRSKSDDFFGEVYTLFTEQWKSAEFIDWWVILS